jgi:hypothetical protein
LNDNGGRITLDDATNGGRAATFDFSGDGATRSISFSLDSMGPRFSVTDLAALTEQRFVAMEADAMKRLGRGRVVYLESVNIGAHPFVQKAGPQLDVCKRSAATIAER